MALSRANAAKAVVLIDSDPEARARFEAAYTGDEDAVAALREAADPAEPSAASLEHDARIKELERAAYGRANTPEEEATAARASAEIAWEQDHRARIALALDDAVAAIVAPSADAMSPGALSPGALSPGVPSGAVPPPVSTGEQDQGEGSSARRLPVRVIVLIALLAGLVVGAGIATVFGVYLGADRVVGQAKGHDGTLFCGDCASTPTPTPSSTRQPIVSLVTRTYTVQQIAGWFAATSTSDDTFPEPDYLSFIGLGSSNTRFIASSDNGWSLWIAKSTMGETCLVMNGTVQGQQIGSVSACLPDVAIANSKALVINQHGIDATLTSRDLVVALSSS